jgi:hypothetical protein
MKTIKIKDYLGNLIYVDITNLGLSELIELRNSLVGYEAYAVLNSMILNECMQSKYTKKYNRIAKRKRKAKKIYKERND